MKRFKIWKILNYFIIYSVIGYLLETIYAVFTKYQFESRQSFLYGPFCIVYGIAAIFLILFLNKYKNNNIKLFIFGMIIGCMVEYFSSLFAEIILHVKWWDYSNEILNINGRTCLYYAILWGTLSIILINYINPVLDNLIDKYYKNSFKSKSIISIITLFLLLDGLISCYAIDNFITRISYNYDIKIKGVNKDKYSLLFDDNKMMMTYPNLIVVTDKEENLHLEDVLPNIKNYYYRF